MFLILTCTLYISKGIWLLPTQKIEKNPIFCLFTKSQNSPVESLTVPPRQLVSGRGGSVEFFWLSSSRCPYGRHFYGFGTERPRLGTFRGFDTELEDYRKDKESSTIKKKSTEPPRPDTSCRGGTVKLSTGELWDFVNKQNIRFFFIFWVGKCKVYF